MKIAVCDDNAADRKKLCALIKAYCGRNSLSAEVLEFDGGGELLRRMKQTEILIVFLDILLEEGYGIELARIIRGQYGGCIMFFCTQSREHAIEAYGLNVLHYLLKPAQYPDVEKALDRCGDKLRARARTLLVAAKPEKRVMIKDILYVEIYGKNCHIHTGGGVFAMRGTIRGLEKELGGVSFLRCHRSFIVNMEHVREYGQADFILDNGERVPIRQEGRAKIKQAFREYSSTGSAEK